MTIANTIKSLGAGATMSEDDIRHHLKDDHDRFKTWTKAMAEGERTAERARAFAQLKPSLTAHARVEESIAYDSIIGPGNDKETDTLGREGYVEHHLSDHLLKRLTELDPSTDEWIAHAKVLHELLGHHIQEEESDIFAKLGAKFSREQLEAMGQRFERDKARFVATGNPKGRSKPVKSAPTTERVAPRAGKRKKAAPRKSATAKKGTPRRGH